jgi:aryl-alcohol dehydrogenase-like predicted oxidoreductase
MRYRAFGATGIEVSEIGFGAWGIGGAYGAVSKRDAIDALACAEDYGCNFVDSALVYGDAEAILGEFLVGRREKWIVATKYSGQTEGMRATIERQLRLLRTDVIDFYQVHWYPRGAQEQLFEELANLKHEGKVRFAGVSLYSPTDIRDASRRADLDGFQVEHSLLEPNVMLTAEPWVTPRLGVVVRSALAGGLLSGRYVPGTDFKDAGDQRAKWSREKVDRSLRAVEALRSVSDDLRALAIGYPLASEGVSTVIVGTKSAAQAKLNFGEPVKAPSRTELERISRVQRELRLRSPWWYEALTRWKLRLA